MHFTVSLSFFLLALLAVSTAQPDVPGGHLVLSRRGGRFATHEIANLTHLAALLAQAEARYGSVRRVVAGNQLVRQWREHPGDEEGAGLFDTIGQPHRWYAQLRVGEPPQTLELDIDMLSPDFYSVRTTSGKGKGYDASLSSSHGPASHADHAHPICSVGRDIVHLPGLQGRPFHVDIPTCTPPKSSRYTLAHSGTVLGLGPPGPLARLPSSTSPSQSLAGPIWSLTLLDTTAGILTLGCSSDGDGDGDGGAATPPPLRTFESARARASLEAEHFGRPHATPAWIESRVAEVLDVTTTGPWRSHFRWTSVRGVARGWWTALLDGIWVRGTKALKNQPALWDVNAPFILAPRQAARRFWESVGGARRLGPPHDAFWAFPCLNGVEVAVEVDGWMFPIMRGEGVRADALHGPAGGRLSLGKLSQGSGYCVGAVVESRMGERGECADSGMRDTWVLGEPFFIGLGVVFDVDEMRIGLRMF